MVRNQDWESGSSGSFSQPIGPTKRRQELFYEKGHDKVSLATLSVSVLDSMED